MTSRNDFRSRLFVRGRVYINTAKIKEKKMSVFFLSKTFPARGVKKNNNNAPLIKVSIRLFLYTFKVFTNIKTYALYNKTTPR